MKLDLIVHGNRNVKSLSTEKENITPQTYFFNSLQEIVTPPRLLKWITRIFDTWFPELFPGRNPVFIPASQTVIVIKHYFPFFRIELLCLEVTAGNRRICPLANEPISSFGIVAPSRSIFSQKVLLWFRAYLLHHCNYCVFSIFSIFENMIKLNADRHGRVICLCS